MIVPTGLRTVYNHWFPVLKHVRDTVEDTLCPFCNKEGFIFVGRLKTVESVAEKVESGRFARWQDLDDLYACTVAVPLSGDENRVSRFVERVFRIQQIKSRDTQSKPPDSFRFDSTRVIARLRTPPGGEPETESSASAIDFEVQIKSIFDFAWAKTTHALVYKSDLVDWKRSRLASHLKAATEQIDFLISGFERASELVPDGRWPELDDKAEIRRFFSDQVEKGCIPPEVAPKDWSRFADNFYRAVRALEGIPPSAIGSRPLVALEKAFGILDREFQLVGLDRFPRSLSLFQFVVGLLAASGEFKGSRKDYFIPTGEEFRTLFGNTSLPGREFSFRAEE